MPEFKELERSLLARMFRSRIIDAPTFMSRVQALGYDPEDVFLMLRLEQKEAVRSRVWSGRPEPLTATVPDHGMIQMLGAVFDIATFSYFYISATTTAWYGGTMTVFFEWINAAGGIIQTDEVAKGEDVFTFSKALSPVVGAVKARIRIQYHSGVVEPLKVTSFFVVVDGVMI